MLSLLLFVGCGEQNREKVFAVVNGRSLTESDVRDAVLIESRIAELAKRPVRENDFVRWANATSMRLIGPMINAMLLEGAAVAEGLKPETNDVAEVVSAYSRRIGASKGSIDELAEMFGDLKEPVRRQMQVSALLSAYARTHWKDPVPDYMVTRFYHQVTNDMKSAERIDALARKNAAAAYARLEKGEKWADVAGECSEDRLLVPANARFSEFWTMTGSDAFGMKELAALLPLMSPGSYTRPLDTSQGMLIVRLNEKKNNLYYLSRMMFRMANPVSLPRNEEEARKIVMQRFLESREATTMERLQRAAKIEYPMGTNFTYRIWKEQSKK